MTVESMGSRTRDDEARLAAAIEALRMEQPGVESVAASAIRVANRLGLDDFRGLEVDGVDQVAGDRMDAIGSCDDVQHLLGDFRSGRLSAAKSLLIEAHLRDCGACLRQSRGGAKVLDWSRDWTANAPGPKAVATGKPWRSKAMLGWGVAAGLALLAGTSFLYQAYWQVPPGVRAQVESLDGDVYSLSDGGDHRLAAGAALQEGELLRTSGGAHAVLRLSDGSTVEVKERSVLGVGARGRTMTIGLGSGAVIVQAAKRNFGHLYVKTPDCRVAVTGTVFSVNSGIKGSRVAVLQGSVLVDHAGVDTRVNAGDQLATNANLDAAPVAEQIAWSHDRDRYLPLLAQFSALQKRIEQIPFPQSRYTSDLLARVPAGTLLYVSIPNLGEFLSQANAIFEDQLKQSPALQAWWAQGNSHNTAELDALVNKVRQGSQFLGEEIVVVGVKQGDASGTPGFAVIADLARNGFGDFLRQQLPSSGSEAVLQVLDEASLNGAPVSTPGQHGGYALVRAHEAVFASSLTVLKQVNAQLNAGDSGFSAGAFGQQIKAAYGRGAGVILAADVHQMMGGGGKLLRVSRTTKGVAQTPSQNSGRISGKDPIEGSGLEDVQYLIAEHRETNGKAENHLNVQFAGSRQRVASWLGTAAPIGSLDFVTPNAAVAVALLSKDPKTIADDILSMAMPQDAEGKAGLSEAEAKLHIDFREDVAANLGGDFLVALDGPVLPTPSWKAVVEIRDAAAFERTLERLAESVSALARRDKQDRLDKQDKLDKLDKLDDEDKQGNEDKQNRQAKGTPGVAIEVSGAGSQRYYAVRNLASGAVVANYTFADGYLIVAPSRALLMEALRTHDSGTSLGRSASFKALLPRDENDNYSAIAYQNLSPELGPLLSQFSGEAADAIRQLASDAHPTAICAWGKDNRIEAASDSHLLGFDFLTLGSLLTHGNKAAPASVRD